MRLGRLAPGRLAVFQDAVRAQRQRAADHSSGFPTLQKVMSRFKDNDNVAFVAIQTVFEGFASNTFDHAKQVARKYKLTIPVGQSGAPGKRSHVMAPDILTSLAISLYLKAFRVQERPLASSE